LFGSQRRQQHHEQRQPFGIFRRLHAELETALDRERSQRWGGWFLEHRTLHYPAYPGGCYPINVERFTSSAQMLDMINASRDEDFGDTGMRGRRGLGAA
jgi:hypothetical protein